MKSLFIKTDADEIIERLNKFNPSAGRLWGKMSVDQMLAHCSVGIEIALGCRYLKQNLINKIIGPFFKNSITGNTPVKRGVPTHPGFVVIETGGFEAERKRLTELIEAFYNGGKAGCTDNPHPFFGRLTPTQWGALMYKHINHHLTQFGG